MSKFELEVLDRIDRKERKLANLKAELEMVDYEEFEALHKRLQFLEARFNELIAWLIAEDREREVVFDLLKVKEEST